MASSIIINNKISELEKFWKNKRVLITGGSKGLGKALTLNLDQLGAKIVIVARSSNDLKSVSTFSDNIHSITADISNKNDIYKISGQTMAILGGIDVLINNASSLGPLPMKTLIDTECEDFIATFETNLFGPFRLTKALLGPMILQRYGLVVNITSDASISAYQTWGSYGVSKSALDHLTRIWSEELSLNKINFLTVDPGDMLTDMHLSAMPDADIDSLFKPEEVSVNLIKFLSQENFDQIRYSAEEWRSLL